MRYKKSLQHFTAFILSLQTIICFAQMPSVMPENASDTPSEMDVIRRVRYMDENELYIQQLTQTDLFDLPVAMSKTIGTTRYTIAVDSSRFDELGKGYFSAFAAIELPGTNKTLAFKGTNIEFNPAGVMGGQHARLMLVSPVNVKINDMVTMQLTPDGNNFVEWDCNGFKTVGLSGDFIFNSEKLIPDAQQTSEKDVRARFRIVTGDIHQFVAQISMTPFQVKGLNNWGFAVSEATVDMSEVMNAGSMVFPPGYQNPDINQPLMWKGFFLKNLNVFLPPELCKASERTKISVNNLLIDHTGLSGNIATTAPIFSTQEGSMSGWGFSIDELGLAFVNNVLTGGHFRGKINIPIIEKGDGVDYAAGLFYNQLTHETDYNFTFSPSRALEVPAFAAKINILPSSRISVTKTGNRFKPVAILNGDIAFKHKAMNSNGNTFAFQDLTIITDKPYITNGVFSLSTNKGLLTMASYPISLSALTFGINNGNPLFGFEVGFNATEKINTGFSLKTGVTIYSKLVEKPYISLGGETFNKISYEFDRVKVNDIGIHVNTAAFKLEGIIGYRENDPVYGDGFKGQIRFSVPQVIQGEFQASACFGAKEHFRYYYVDAAVPTHIPLGTTPIILNQLIGGLFYHMTPGIVQQREFINASKNMKAFAYIPDQNTATGIKAGVGYQFGQSDKAANGHVLLELAFTEAGGLSYVRLKGDVFILAVVGNNDNAPIKGDVDIIYDHQNQVVDALALVTIQAKVVKGVGEAKMHFSQKDWYVCVGKPSKKVHVDVINVIGADAYFMTGNNLEAPALPIGSPERDGNSLAGGKGFCAGASIYNSMSSSFEVGPVWIEGAYNFGAGFDMMMMDYGNNAHCTEDGSPVGMNGWLVQGGIYAGMQGGIYAGWKKWRMTIVEGAVNMKLNGQFPKPVYLSGAGSFEYSFTRWIKGSFDFNFTYGSTCSVQG